MRIVEILALENGAHRNQTVFGEITPPDGWVVAPDDVATPNFPFGDFTYQNIDGVPTMTGWTAGVKPQETPESAQQSRPDINQMAADIETLKAEAKQAREDREVLSILLGGAE